MPSTNGTQKKNKTLEEILALKDTEPEEFYVPHWDTTVTIRGLTKQQQMDIRARSIVDGQVDPTKAQAGMLVEGMVEPKVDEDAAAALYQKSAGPVDAIIARILVLSGMKEDGTPDLSGKQATFSPKS